MRDIPKRCSAAATWLDIARYLDTVRYRRDIPKIHYRVGLSLISIYLYYIYFYRSIYLLSIYINIIHPIYIHIYILYTYLRSISI
jgi:hypothetical protein